MHGVSGRFSCYLLPNSRFFWILQDDESGSRQQVDKRSDFDFLGGGGDNTALKKKGLCLVPLSMVVNYLG